MAKNHLIGHRTAVQHETRLNRKPAGALFQSGRYLGMGGNIVMTKWTGSMMIPGTVIGVEFDVPGEGSIIPDTPPPRRWIAADAAKAAWPHFDLWIPDRTIIVCLMKDGELYLERPPAVFMTKIDTALVATGGPVPYIFRRKP